MKYTEAFKALGYSLFNPRQQWTAEIDGGICITLRRPLLSNHNGLPYYDMWERWPEGAAFLSKRGHTWRTAHLHRSLLEFLGYVDVIIVDGDEGEGYKKAHPWLRKESRWKITQLDLQTGYFRAEVDPQPTSSN
jgi:hypothetical protein